MRFSVAKFLKTFAWLSLFLLSATNIALTIHNHGRLKDLLRYGGFSDPVAINGGPDALARLSCRETFLFIQEFCFPIGNLETVERLPANRRWKGSSVHTVYRCTVVFPDGIRKKLLLKCSHRPLCDTAKNPSSADGLIAQLCLYQGDQLEVTLRQGWHYPYGPGDFYELVEELDGELLNMLLRRCSADELLKLSAELAKSLAHFHFGNPALIRWDGDGGILAPCHGDLHQRNVFVLPTGHFAFIDLRNLAIAHVSRDLHGFLDSVVRRNAHWHSQKTLTSAMDAFIEAYRAEAVPLLVRTNTQVSELEWVNALRCEIFAGGDVCDNVTPHL
jgi:hypothetical protein